MMSVLPLRNRHMIRHKRTNRYVLGRQLPSRISGYQDFMEHRNITELTRMVAVECIDEIAIYEDRKIEVSFTHWQDYSAII